MLVIIGLFSAWIFLYSKNNQTKPPMTGSPMSRKHNGQRLADKGKYAEALAEYLWCFDEGGASPEFVGVRVSFLMLELERLSQVYPPTRDALLSRRDAAAQKMIDTKKGSEDNRQAIIDWVALNQPLADQAATLNYYDRLRTEEPDSPLLPFIAIQIESELKAREDSAAKARPPQD
jgi:hypothetical protein